MMIIYHNKQHIIIPDDFRSKYIWEIAYDWMNHAWTNKNHSILPDNIWSLEVNNNIIKSTNKHIESHSI